MFVPSKAIFTLRISSCKNKTYKAKDHSFSVILPITNKNWHARERERERERIAIVVEIKRNKEHFLSVFPEKQRCIYDLVKDV